MKKTPVLSFEGAGVLAPVEAFDLMSLGRVRQAVHWLEPTERPAASTLACEQPP